MKNNVNNLSPQNSTSDSVPAGLPTDDGAERPLSGRRGCPDSAARRIYRIVTTGTAAGAGKATGGAAPWQLVSATATTPPRTAADGPKPTGQRRRPGSGEAASPALSGSGASVRSLTDSR